MMNDEQCQSKTFFVLSSQWTKFLMVSVSLKVLSLESCVSLKVPGASSIFAEIISFTCISNFQLY